MDFEMNDFTGKIVGVVIAVVIVAVVAVPIIHDLVTDPDGDGPKTATITDPTLITIINVIPVFLVLAVLMTVVYLFMRD